MRRPIRKTLCALALVAFGASAQAAVEYEFTQTTRSDSDPTRPARLTGRGTIDEGRSRVEFTGGSIYPAGTYVISDEGGRRLVIVDPSEKTYAVVDVTAVANAVGSSPIKIENLKTNMEKLGDRPIVAGLPTDHYRMTASYDMTIHFGELSVKQGVQTIVEKWTTAAFGDVAQSFFAGGVPATGNPELDRIIEAETSKFSGFPLRQTVTVLTTPQGAGAPKGQSSVRTMRRQTTEMVVTSVKALEAPAARFAIPAGYRRIERPKLLEQGAAQTLTLEPETP